jgi:heme exporter protein D
MMWESWSAFWDMGGRGFYVWGSYAVAVVCIIAELWLLAARRKNTRTEIKRQLAAERE